jgi:beta-lactamase superfamily II metal-dependent hydrolase
MLTIEMLPARHGDCLWIEYGHGADRARILIDGGPGFAYAAGLRAKIAALAARERQFELAVCTHIDADHIEGLIRLFGEPALGCSYREVWYNAWPQVSGGQPASFGALQGEYLAALLGRIGVPWNAAFPARGGVRTAAAVDDLSPITLPGGARLTLLSPSARELGDLAKVWDKELERAGLAPDDPEEALARLKADRKFKAHVSFGVEGPDPRALAAAPFSEDNGAPNGSSIAFLLEAGGRSALLLGDAHPGVLVAHIDRLLARRKLARLAVDVVKLPHHGSENNLDRELVARIAADRWLFSSDGTFFGHPDPEAVARVITGKQENPQLVFNYRTKRTAIWDDERLQREYGYRVAYPEAGTAGIRVAL